MEASYKQYLEDLYSFCPGSEFLGLQDFTDPVLNAHKILFGTGGFGKTSRFPNLMISRENSPEEILHWMICCLDMVSIHRECYIHIRSGPWGHLEIIDRTRWLSSLWGMEIPQTNDAVIALLLLTADQSQALYFVEQDRVLEVYMGRIK